MAQDFLSSPADYSDAHGFGLTLKSGKSVVVILGATKREDGTFPLKVEGDAQEYAVPSYVAEQLDDGLAGLRDLSLMNFDVSKATKLSITSGSSKTVAVKDGESWKLVEPKAAPAGVTFDPQQVVAQLNRLRNARAAKAVEKAALGAASVTVEAIVENKPVTLVFGAETGSNAEVYVRGNADTLVYVATGADKSSWTTGAQLFNKPAPPPDFGNMQGLEQLPPDIRAKLMEQLKQQRN